MVAIVAGSDLGLSLGSLATLGQRGAAGPSATGRNGELAYVNSATGNLVLQSSDEWIVGRGPDQRATRTYNSLGLFTDDNGDNWSSGFYGQHIGNGSPGGPALTRTDRDGAVSRYFYESARGQYVSRDGAGAFDTITIEPGTGHYIWRDGSSGREERYDAASRRLVSERDANGQTLSYTYGAGGRIASVQGANGETTHYDYIGANLAQIRTVTQAGAATVTATRVRYAYDTSNRLSRVSVDLSPADHGIADGKTYTTTYTYDGTSKRVASVAQSDGTGLAIAYQQVGGTYRVASVIDALGNATLFTYDTVARRTTVTDPLGAATVFDHDSESRLVRVTAAPAAGVAQVTSFEYDANGDLVRTTDAENRSVVMAYDGSGNQVLQRDATGNTVTRTYDAQNQLLAETLYAVADPDGAGPAAPSEAMSTRYVYGATGKYLLRFVLTAEGRITEYRYDADGQRIAAIRYAHGAYAVSGLAAGAVPTEAQMIAWVAAANRAWSSRVDSEYDFRGHLQKQTAYARVDATGAGIRDGSESTTQFVYDSSGLLLQSVSAVDGTTSYTYDGLRRRLTETDALARVTLTQYDDANNRSTVTLAGGLITTSTFDRAGRLVSVQRSSAAAAGLVQDRYFYDSAGRLLMTQDATGIGTWMLYDDAGRKVADVDATGSLTEYRYDRNDQLTMTVAYASAVDTALLVDAAGIPTGATLASVKPLDSAADRKTWRIHDAANRLVRTIDGTGAVRAMTYDGASRLVEVTRHANPIATSGLGSAPAASEASPSAHADDRTERSFHDADGRAVAMLDAAGYLSEQAYDATGRLVATLRHATPTSATLRAAGTLAQLRPVAPAPGDIRSVFLYDGKGQAIGLVDGENHLTEKLYDAAGNLARTVRYANRVSGVVATTATLDAIRPPSHPEDQATSWTYDTLNRVTKQVNAEGTVTLYGYDTAGNLVTTTQGAGQEGTRTITARFDVLGRLVGELSAEGSALLTGGQTQAEVDAIWSQHGLAHTYDAAGRRTSSTDAVGNTTLYFHDKDGRVQLTVNALGEAQENEYNELGQIEATVRYGTRIALAGLSGGIVSSAVRNTLDAVRSASLDSRSVMTYDLAGNLASTRDALGNTTTVSFDAFGQETRRVSPQGGAAVMEQSFVYDRRGLLASSVSDATGINVITTSVYDAFGRLVSARDANNNLIERRYDKLGRVVETSDRANSRRFTTYDAFERVLTQTDGLGETTTYSYSKSNRSITVKTPENVVMTTARTRHGQTQTVTDGNGRTTTYLYDRNGNLLETSTAGVLGRRTYDRADRLVETVDGNDVAVVYSYDKASRLLSRRVDPSGLNLETTYGHDANGRQVSVTDPAGVVTTTLYDLKGQTLRQTLDPGGLALETDYSYDAQGRVLTVTSPLDTVTRYTYDKLGRRIKEQVDPAGLNITRSYSYDDNGNVVMMTDPNNGITRYAYDASDRLTFEVDPAGNTTHTVYDPEGRRLRTTGYVRPISLTSLPAVATVAQIAARVVASPGMDAIEARRYDKAGRLRFTVDGAGAVVQYWHDVNGNVVKQTAYVNAIAPAGWNGTTDPVVIADSSRDRTVRSVYDAFDRRVYTADATGAVTRNVYDANGNLTKEVRYAMPVGAAASPDAVAAHSDDRTSVFIYDKANRLSWSADPTGAVSASRYDDNGNRIEQRLYAATVVPGGVPSTVAAGASDRVLKSTYDKAGRLTYSVDAMGHVSLNGYDKAGRVTSVRRYATRLVAGSAPQSTVTHASDRTESFVYDAAGRIKTHTDALLKSESYTYDGLGNRLTFKNKNGSVWTYAYDAAGRKVTERSPAVDLVSMVADAATGKLTGTLAQAVAIENRLVYDGLGNLTSRIEAVNRPETRATSYEYDAKGRQTKVVYPVIGSYSETAAMRLANAAAGAAARAETATTPITKTFYNTFGDAVASIDRHGATRLKAYDGRGRVAYEVDAMGHVTGYARNAFGEAIAVTRFAGGTTLAQIAPTSAATSPTTVQIAAAVNASDAQNRRLANSYDRAGRVVQVVEPATTTYDSSNGTYDTAGRTTKNAYNGFGELVQVSRLANRDTSAWVHSHHYFDAGGRSVATVDPMGYLTTRAYDSEGNVVSTKEYATALGAGAWTAAAYATPAAAAEDRATLFEYDLLNRKISETRVGIWYSDDLGSTRPRGDVETTYGYDAVGNLTRTTDAYGGNTYSYYDALGRVKAVAAPNRNSTTTGTALSPLIAFWRDAHGNVTQRIERANAPSVVNETTYAVAANSASDRIAETLYDKSGNRLQVEDAMQFVTFHSYTTDGRLAKTWRTATGHDGVAATVYTAYAYDLVGQVTRIYVPKASSGSAIETRMSYNAFGEVTSKGINGAQETFEYDSAGNLWRTNSGNGKHKVFLYDLLGRATAEIGSAGVGRGDVDMSTATSASQARTWTSTRRTETKYDALGRAVSIIEPERLTKQGGVTIRQATANASMVSSNSYLWQPGVNTAVLVWDGVENRVSATWTDMSYLGSGDVKVEVHHKTKEVLTAYGEIHTGSQSKVESQIFEGHLANAGATVRWSAGSIQSITKLVVYKKNVNGDWVRMLDRSAFGAYGTIVEAGSPVDPSTSLTLAYRKSTSTEWLIAPTSVFGDSHRFDASGVVAGTYYYEVRLKEYDEATDVVASGSFVTHVAETDATAVSAWERPVVNQKFDRWGNTIERSDPRNATWRTAYQYDAGNQVVYERRPDAAGNLSSDSPTLYTYYDRLGRKVAHRDAKANHDGWVYDNGGNLVEERHADGGVVRHRYDAFGQRAQTLDALANGPGATAATIAARTTRFDHDKLGRLVAVTHGATSGGSAYVHGLDGNMELVAPTKRNLQETYSYDELGRKLTSKNGAGETTKYAYDSAGNVIETTQPLLQKTTATFDAYGRKATQTDPNGNIATWAFTYFGLLADHNDLANKDFNYTYDNAGQLVGQASGHGQNLAYRYDAAGQLVQITDAALNKISSYAYDEMGNRLREKVVQSNEVYQDNHLAYDTLGRLRDSADNRSHLTFSYDKNNNRTRVTTRVYIAKVDDDDVETLKTEDRYFQYDAMDRQTVVGAVDAAGTAGANTHVLTYDLNGNRLTDRFTGNKVATNATVGTTYSLNGQMLYTGTTYTYSTSTGLVTEKYIYDSLDRLLSTERDGIQVDLRFYDGAGRIVQSGTDGTLPTGYASALNSGLPAEDAIGLETRRYRYDANGRLLYHRVLRSDNSRKHDVDYASASDATGQVRGYDAAGNVLGYQLKNYSGDDYTSTYTNLFDRYEGYVAKTAKVKRSGYSDGLTTHEYDPNGHLIKVTDSREPTFNRTMVNDSAGRVLEVAQGSNALHTLIVNDEMLGRHGVGISDVKPRKSNGDANLAQIAEFDLGYRSINGSYPSPSLGQYEVRQGDTLKSIAQAAYGDGGLWWRIAQANNLAGDSDLRVGQTLTIANTVANGGNTADTFKPYDAGQVVGDTTPSLGKPTGKDGACGGLGQILMIVVAVAVTIYTAGAAAAASSAAVTTSGATATLAAGTTAASMTTWAAGTAALGGAFGSGAAISAGVIGAAVGSVASQAVGLATGVQESFDWRGVALSALSAGVTQGVGASLAVKGPEGLILRAVVSNASTQGVAVVTGLQEKFSWSGVAAAAVGSGVGAAANSAMETTLPLGMDLSAGRLVSGTTAGMAAGLSAAVLRGGRVSIQQIATDAFGNALGNSLVHSLQRGTGEQIPGAVAREAEENPALAQLYRRTLEIFRAGGIADDKAQELALRGFELRDSGGDPQALDAYKLDVLVSRGASPHSAKAFLSYMGLSTSKPEQASLPRGPGEFGSRREMELPLVTVTGERGSGLSAAGGFLFDWQDELAAVGTASLKLGQWMDDHPTLGWGVMAIQAATTPLLFAGQQVLQHSPIGERLNALTGAAFDSASDFVNSEGAIGDKGKAALMTIGAIGALSLAVGGVSMLRNSVNTASMFTRELEQRRITLNFDRDGGVDPHLIDPRVLAQQRLAAMQLKFTPLMARGDAHFLTKHGPQTSLAQQYERASTGGWPNRADTRASDASRFFNAEDMEGAIKQSMALYSGNPDVPVVVSMRKPIGEGFVKVTRSNAGALPEYRQSDTVRVIFDRSGLPKTAYPDIVRNGVVLPPPKF